MTIATLLGHLLGVQCLTHLALVFILLNGSSTYCTNRWFLLFPTGMQLRLSQRITLNAVPSG